MSGGHNTPDGGGGDEMAPTKRRRFLPKRFQEDKGAVIMHDRRLVDILPQPIPSILAPCPTPSTSVRNTEPAVLPATSSTPPPTNNLQTDTLPNIFGIFRRYHRRDLPSHDPEQLVNLETLSNIANSPTASVEELVSAAVPANTSGSSSAAKASMTPAYARADRTSTNDIIPASAFYPYPNEASFQLGEWFWNQGIQKSHESFKGLLKIIGSDSFKPEDIQSTHWDRINAHLALNDWDEEEWMDEDAGWRQSTITIRIPFDSRTAAPGPKDYTITDFYHRSITSIIRERLQRDISLFHLHPYELLWNRRGSTPGTPPVQLYGELYTSPSFLAAHHEVQNLRSQPECDLERVVVGLMFWSDATHLTNFGSAKLWPLYMQFGNDSKYYRCKPSNSSFEHVAYFEQVRSML